MAYGTPHTYKVKLDAALAENVRLQATITELEAWKEKGVSLVSALSDNSTAGVNKSEAIIAEMELLALKEKTDE